ncbi:CubicO group peptidase, beta-lactamase class C family [Fodinibius sediminis]|uniref:CubicO group peptidase, beta-lactamase class C family n=2 Tax=Fodinibius sediminis TaxID=1214077 RepID=A0A521F195_9BACT|nr:CubicO group peptidase, beta-lactamase class C family [Fodinibius sediminis]
MSWNGLNRPIEKWVRKRVYQLLELSVILLVSAGCSNQSIDQGLPVDTFTQQLDVRILSLMDWYNIPGTSIALIQDRKLVWSNAYGYADIKQQKKMTLDAICRTESISKSVTAWGVMKLVERGLINLDDPVQQYLRNWSLPESEYNLNDVTIRKLLSNSSGIPLGSLGEEYSPDSEKPSLRQYLSKEVQLTYEPGSNFEYSNPGFNLLELLIEEVTGRDFSDYMVNEVLTPLGMHNSRFDWDEDWSSRVPMGYDLQGNSVAPYVYPYKASGGLFSTVEDIARFTIAEMVNGSHANQVILSKESIQNIHTPKINILGMFGFVAEDYGFGHFIETLPDGKKAVWHGGQGHGWMTHFHMIPETGDGIVIFTNSQRSWPFIGHILRAWSRWQGVGPVKFSRITTAVSGLRIIIGLILLVTLWCAAHLVNGVLAGKRKLTISLKLVTKTRVMEFFIGTIIVGVLLWAITRDYLFLTSIFPIGTVWLGWTLLVFSVVLLLSAALPVVQTVEPTDSNQLR